MPNQHSSFFIPVKKFKKGYLEMPEEFKNLFVSNASDKQPLWFIDKDSDKYIVEYYPDRNLVSGLAEWYRKYNPVEDSIISLIVLDMVNKEFRISISGEPPEHPKNGLFIGKEYNMVGARKYEASSNYYLPIEDLAKHIFICGITGSGKTVIGKAIIEEAIRNNIPSIIIDLKGDISSLALILSTVDEFKTWVEKGHKGNIDIVAEKEHQHHYANLELFGITKEDALQYKKKAQFRIFTPRSNKGIPIEFGSPLSAPSSPTDLYKADSEVFNNLVNSLTGAFIDRLYPGKKRSRIENERNYLYEIVHYAWLHDIDLRGVNGLRTLLNMVIDPPFQKIGGLPVEDYIDAENRRKRLINKVNTLLSGPETMWFEGEPYTVDAFLKSEEEKVPINIINLVEMDYFEDRSFVVAQITYEIQKWMRKQQGTTYPRIIFFIDEIGGGGGKQALFPSFPYECAAKWGLNYLVRQGRSFGVCCIFATQNPGDIDYKGLSNCHTWIIGKLATERDRTKVMEGMEVWGLNAEKVRRNLATAQSGDFVVKDARGDIKFIKEKWLMSYHRVLTIDEIPKVKHGL
jgi:hypothetical protein